MPPIGNDDLTAEDMAAFAEHGVDLNQPGPVLESVPGPIPPIADTNVAAAGGDTVVSAGQDTLIGGQGADTIVGGQGNDQIAGAPPQGFVPHAALHAERARTAQLQQQIATLTARTNAILSQQREQTQLPPLPSLEEDPLGYIQGLEQRVEQLLGARQEETQHRELDMRLEQDEAAFAAYTPDYNAASEHYVRSRAAELLLFYTPQEAQTIMQNEARAIAQQSWQRGTPAAQTIYTLAVGRGYVKAAAPPPAAAQPALVPPPSPAAIVAAVQAGQDASRSTTIGGGAAPAEVNAEAILAMSDEEFAEHFKIGSKGADARFAAVAGR